MEIVKFNNKPIEISVNFDECANYLTVTIERISKTVYLHDFSYGKYEDETMTSQRNERSNSVKVVPFSDFIRMHAYSFRCCIFKLHLYVIKSFFRNGI